MVARRPSASERRYGRERPRIAPPLPARHHLPEFVAAAEESGINLMPWQRRVGRYLTAVDPDGGLLYRDVVVVVSRQNGKTELLIPKIKRDLRAGRRVLHTAHRMRLARKVFLRLANEMELEAADVRWAQGQEEITMHNGGSYAIVAALRGGRGDSADTLIVDEVREFESEDMTGAIEPTTQASPDPQRVYLSNAGSHKSVVLNDLKRRAEAGDDPELCYLEWSAGPARRIDDRAGWAEGNPAMGHLARFEQNLESAYRRLRNRPSEFKTEHLCQWVISMAPPLVATADWSLTAGEAVGPVRPSLGISLDPLSRAASAMMAWPMTDGRIALVELFAAVGDPIDIDACAEEIKALAVEHRVRARGYSGATDLALARLIPHAKALDGRAMAAASEAFAQRVAAGRLVHDGTVNLDAQLPWAERRTLNAAGGWVVAQSSADQPIPAVLAAVRAVWLASGPRPKLRIG